MKYAQEEVFILQNSGGTREHYTYIWQDGFDWASSRISRKKI
jgi:hypothetical protein